MDTLLVLRKLRVENANAIAGITWGFPAISNFLGFVHALSRKLPPAYELELEGCAVICHEQQVHATQPGGWGDYVFSLTRNPLTQRKKIADYEKGTLPSFIEEGRMHMTVSLLIAVSGELEDEDEAGEIQKLITNLVYSQRLAGGTVVNIGGVELIEPPEGDDLARFERQQLQKLLPGFALVQRSDLLARHTKHCIEQNPNCTPLDSWLDFCALKYQPVSSDGNVETDTSVEWHYVPKPERGWLVPITMGYRGISEQYAPGEVVRARDASVPFRFVESVYSLGEWISPHRARNLEQLIWRYCADPESGWYLCENNYQPNNITI